MALTQEQIQQYRQQYSLDAPGKTAKTTLPPVPVAPRGPTSGGFPQWYLDAKAQSASGSSGPGGTPLPPAKTTYQQADEYANKPAFDMSNEGNPLKAVGKAAVNAAKSVVVKLPYNAIKTVVTGVKDAPQIPGVISGAAKDFNDAAQSQLGLNDQIKKLRDAIAKNQREGKDTTRLEQALKLAGGTKAPSIPADYIVPAAAATVIPAFVKKGYEAGKTTKSVEGTGQGVLEGVRTAFQDLAEDPGQLVPYLLSGKGAIEEGLPKVDTVISKVGGGPKKVTGVVMDVGKSAAGSALDTVRSPLQAKYQSQLYDTYNEVFTGTKSAKKTFDQSIKTGKDPAQFGADNGYVVDVTHGKIDPTSTIAKVKETYVTPRAQLLDDMLAAKDKTLTPDQYISLDEIGSRAKANILKDPLAKGKGNVSKQQAAIDNLIGEFKKQFGSDRVKLEDLNNIKKGQWAESSSFNVTRPDISGFMADTHYQIGSAAKEAIENAVPEAAIRQLNGEIGDAQNFIRNLQKVDGNAVKGGRLGKYFARTLGGIAGSHAGPFGTIGGALAGNYISELMQSQYIAGPLKRSILESIKPNSALYEQAQATLRQLEETPAAIEAPPTPTSTVVPAPLGPEPMPSMVKVNNYQRPQYPTYLTSEQRINNIRKLVNKDNAGKNLDIRPPASGIQYDPLPDIEVKPVKVKLPAKKKGK